MFPLPIHHVVSDACICQCGTQARVCRFTQAQLSRSARQVQTHQQGECGYGKLVRGCMADDPGRVGRNAMLQV